MPGAACSGSIGTSPDELEAIECADRGVPGRLPGKEADVGVEVREEEDMMWDVVCVCVRRG